MVTFTGDVLDRQIILKAGVAPVGTTDPDSMLGYDALLDTGAQGTLSSSKVVDKVGLIPIGRSTLVPANGQPIEVDKFRAVIGIGVVYRKIRQLYQHEMDLSLLPYQPTNHDILFGMDILLHFHVTLVHGKFVFSI